MKGSFSFPIHKQIRMGSRQRRSGADKSKEGADRKMIETIQEATGATEGDIRVMLEECNFDANETTSRLIDSALLCQLVGKSYQFLLSALCLEP